MTESDKPTFAAAMARLCLALREKEPDAVQMRTYFKALSDLDVELVVLAADRLSTSAEWFPKVPEWRKIAVAIASERRDAIEAVIRKRHLAGLPPLCAACEDTGFTPAGDRYRRCECAEMRRLEVLGRRPMPALPEASATTVNTERRLLAAVKAAVKGF